MVVGFYPGAGGNRYISYIKGQEWTTLGTIYDLKSGGTVQGCEPYLDSTEQIPVVNTTDYVVTHSVNSKRISECFPGHKIVLLRADLKSSLRREWSLKGKNDNVQSNPNYEQNIIDCYNAIRADSWPVVDSFDQYQQAPEYIKQEVVAEFSKNLKLNAERNQYLNSAYTTICWHHEFYNRYPYDDSCAEVINIDSSTEFGLIMRKELDLYKDNELFNFAWSVFEKYGTDAPIIGLYDRQHSLQTGD